MKTNKIIEVGLEIDHADGELKYMYIKFKQKGKIVTMKTEGDLTKETEMLIRYLQAEVMSR